MKKVLVGLIEHLGDIVACEPVVRYLKQNNKNVYIIWAVSIAYKELIDSNPYIDETLVVDCLTDWIKLTKHGKFDKIVDLHVNYRICQCCGIPLVKSCGNQFVNIHEWFDYGGILEAFSVGAGLPKLSIQPNVYIQSQNVEVVDKIGLPDKYCVLHVHSSDSKKDWIKSYWITVAIHIQNNFGYTIVEIGANKTYDGLRLKRKYINLINKLSILDTAEVIRRSTLFLGVDSGPAHLANALLKSAIILLGRYGLFHKYVPFSGFYAKNSNHVRLIHNLTGSVSEYADIDNVLDEVDYVLRQLPDILLNKPIYNSIEHDVQERNNLNLNNTYPKLFAFYLPQFHPIPENDWAHELGFTEWHNVIKSKPLFKEHNQPKVPGELGFYDLRSFEVMQKQIELAIEYGVNGFCFYYYYFQGRKILYKPIENFINSNIDFPFLFLWANENWSKRWDGGDKEIIIAQNHSAEDDIYFIRELLPVFNDRRYVKINGKPILMVYKTHLFPDIIATTEVWRTEILKMGLPGIYLVMVDDWIDVSHPRQYGFDASYEIPSNLLPDYVLYNEAQSLELVNDFAGKIVDYSKFATYHMGRSFPDYKRFRTVMLPWDNTARYGQRAVVHIETRGDSYKLWLIQALIDTYRRYEEPEERIVFLHSWNEWCEGTYIEPDQKHGRHYLEQTREAVSVVQKTIDLLCSSDSKNAQIVVQLLQMMDKKEVGNIYAMLDARVLRNTLNNIYSSKKWRFINKLVKLKQKVLRVITR